MRFNLISWPMACGALLALSACSGSGAAASGAQGATSAAPDTPPVASGQPPRNRCDAQAAQSFGGQPFGATTLEQARAAARAEPGTGTCSSTLSCASAKPGAGACPERRSH